MPSETIQWFPGHMAKTRRMIQDSLSSVDIVIELLDARIPKSSKNPEIDLLIGDKPSLTLLNKASLADPASSKAWAAYYQSVGKHCLFTDCRTGEGIDRIMPSVRRVLKEKIERYREKGLENRRLKAMIVGIPNVGKSTLINRLVGSKKAKAEDRPGVTVNKQWVSTSIGLDLLDMPGILWPRFEERRIGENLAVTGAIKDAILDTETIAQILCVRLRDVAPELFFTRYKLNAADFKNESGEAILLAVGRRRGMLVSGGEIDTLRTSEMLLDEFRAAKIGRITLEAPEYKENIHAEL